MDNMNDYDNLIKTIIDNKEGCLKIKTISKCFYYNKKKFIILLTIKNKKLNFS